MSDQESYRDSVSLAQAPAAQPAPEHASWLKDGLTGLVSPAGHIHPGLKAAPLRRLLASRASALRDENAQEELHVPRAGQRGLGVLIVGSDIDAGLLSLS